MAMFECLNPGSGHLNLVFGAGRANYTDTLNSRRQGTRLDTGSLIDATLQGRGC